MLSEPTYPYHRGGAGKCAHLFASGLAGRGHDVVLASPTPGAELTREEVDGALAVRVPRAAFPAPRDAGTAVLAPLLELLEGRRGPFDVVHDAGGFTPYYYPVDRAFQARGARLLVHVQLVATGYLHARYGGAGSAATGFVPPWSKDPAVDDGPEYLQYAALRSADRVVATSAREAALLRNIYGIDENRVRVLPNPVPAELFALGPPEVAPATLAFAGRVHDPVKGADIVAEAMRLLLSRRGDARLLLLAHKVPAVLRPLADRIDHAGWLVEDLEIGRALQGAVALVMPSRYEPFGMVAAEAMAVGVPVIVSPVCGVADFVEDGVNAFLLGADESRWAGEIAAHALSLLDDGERGVQVGAAAASTARRLANHLLASGMELIYEDLLAEELV